LRAASRENGPGEAGAYGFESLRLRQTFSLIQSNSRFFWRAAARFARRRFVLSTHMCGKNSCGRADDIGRGAVPDTMHFALSHRYKFAADGAS